MIVPRSATRDGSTWRAARQAGLLFAVSAVLNAGATTSFPERREPLLVLATVDLVIVAVIALLPWRRWPTRSTAVLALAAWVVIAGSTYVLGGVGSGSGAFFVLAFAWLGLHHTRRVVLANVPLAAAAYVAALVLGDASNRSLMGTVVVIPFAVVVGLIIEDRVRRLNVALGVVEEEQRWRAALMATLAHDVRSPLTTISGVLELVAEDPDLAPDLTPLVDSAARQVARLTTLADDLLDLERVQGGKLVLDCEDVEIDELARQVVGLMDDHDIDVRVEPGLRVRADPRRLQQVVVNLVSNAQRHGAPPIVLGARRAEAGVEVFVRDHGPGVPEAHQASLFQRFGHTDGGAGSVGLGLWIVQLLARAHGGEACYRRADPGSEFVVTLPAPQGRVLTQARPGASTPLQSAT